MAHYVRFEIYIPVIYTVEESDPKTKEHKKVPHAFPSKLVDQFVEETIDKYHGMTQANPVAPPMFKGWWQEEPGKAVEIDRLTFLFGLVRADQETEAVEFFDGWKQRLEQKGRQKKILLVYYGVQTIGDFF